MNYNARDISERVRRKKELFFTRLLFSLAIATASVILAIVLEGTTVTFVFVLCAIAAAVFAIRTVALFHPKTLFSHEITGTNVKEHEYVTRNVRTTFSYRGRNLPRRNTSSFTGGKNRTKAPTSAIVYIKLENGDVTYIDGLFGAQTDVYEIGDTLYRYPGTKFPIILDRKTSSQPCPICGTVNKDTEPKCITCDLEITK